MTKGLLKDLEKRYSTSKRDNKTEVKENTQNTGQLTPQQRRAINWVTDMVEQFHDERLLKEEEYAFFKKYAGYPDFDEKGKPISMPPEYWEQGAKYVFCIIKDKRYKTYF